MSEVKAENFVTVVAVGTGEQEVNNENINFDSNSPGYVTVLTIGDTENNNKILKDVTEEVIVYRLPGERLGFGLKFEGGTKASEFVKRLFIQSCAADSPASRVKSSWGKLTEGDEVLDIDSIPVNTMTRIDCVRCLKDSNVAIKLLVRHIYENQFVKNKTEEKVVTDSSEDKRTPPPPPPVPPRKIPRKMLKSANTNVPKENKDTLQDNSSSVKQPEPVTTNGKTKKLQSPRSSTKSYYSPDIRDRRFSDGNLVPPDAEVYVDLFLRESAQSLSESDDTGSTVSTVIDRLGSYPTTTTSSFSGSLPSTPTSVQRKLDITNIEDEDTLALNKSITKPLITTKEENNNIILDEVNPLSFQDAPLSYGNENTQVIVPDEMTTLKEQPLVIEETKQFNKKPPVPPRSKDTVLTITNSDINKDNKKSESLPRLVDFVPKSANGLKENIENSTELMKLFLENERYKTNFIEHDVNENDNLDHYNSGIELYSSKWSLSSQLATIGEVEEESGSDFNSNRPSLKPTPVVIVESADSNTENDKSLGYMNETLNNRESDGIMATLPSDSRQPPDGHEFPDFIEDINKQSSQNYYKEKDSPYSNFSSEYQKPVQNDVMEDFPKTNNLILSHAVSASNTDLRQNLYDSTEDLKYNESVPEPAVLHTRSQSLIDMSSLSKQKNAKWNQLIEQRRRGLSKLKGLVIPETSESDIIPTASPSVNIPEIKSHTTTFVSVPKVDSPPVFSTNNSDTLKSSVILHPWTSNNTSNLPKYSPAFKRKSLQVYPNINKSENYDYSNSTHNEFSKYCDKSNQRISKSSDDDLNPPKSLESISSPTRSDCSFDYISSTKKSNREHNDSPHKTTTNKLEDESDNDSAVSSSQSSYNSRFSPPPSPTRSYELNPFKKFEDEDRNAQNRLLKPSSVEAINRKNILASAKCRSGKDIKIGSPVIKRKTEEAIANEKAESLVKEEEIKPVVNETKNEIRTPVKAVENVKETPVQTFPRKCSLPNMSVPLRNGIETKENRLVKELYRPSSILAKKNKPINVKALKENFENFGSSPPPMPQKVPTYRTQVTKNVKAEIARTESEIALHTEVVKKPDKPLKPLEIKPGKSFENKEVKVESIRKLSRMNSITIILNLDSVETSLGITLSGGIDEDKEITVHRIRYGSVAYHDGRLKRGDKIISINGKTTAGLTHAEATEMLKEKVKQFIIHVEEGADLAPSPSISNLSRRSSSMSTLSEPKTPIVDVAVKKPNHVISFVKDGSGLGFSIEGGRDSPLGDVPLLVKKIFTGGAADKNGELMMGDELININEVSFANLTRIEAWNLMKKIPDGTVNIHVYR